MTQLTLSDGQPTKAGPSIDLSQKDNETIRTLIVHWSTQKDGSHSHRKRDEVSWKVQLDIEQPEWQIHRGDHREKETEAQRGRRKRKEEGDRRRNST
jgi:hypothetical protein